MRSSPSQVRLLVMVLVAWCALSAAPVVANSPSLPAAFFVIAVGLVAAVTLRFSTLVGLAMAVLGTALFAISVVLDPASGASRSGVQGLAGVLSRLDQLLPALVAAVSLVGTAVCASLASWEIDGRPGAILEPVGTEEESEGKLEQHASVVEPATGSRGAVTAAAEPQAQPAAAAEVSAAKEEPTVQEGAPKPAVLEEPVASRDPAAVQPAEEPPAIIPEPAAAEEAAALHRSEGERVVAREKSGAVEEPVRGGEEPAAEEPAADEEAAAREGRATAAKDSPVEEPAVANEPSPAAEPASAVSPESGGAVKGEEIAAGEFEERNGKIESDQVEAARPDWRRRRRPDDDVARRLPRRRKR
jgi:hypothetical protein